MLLDLYKKHKFKLASELYPSHTSSDSFIISYEFMGEVTKRSRGCLATVLKLFEFGKVIEVERYNIETQDYVLVYKQ